MEDVLADLGEAWHAALGDGLRGLYAHGSLVAGDFARRRSDLDVLAVLAIDPDETLIGTLATLHAGLDERHPEWAGRVEVEYISIGALRDLAGHVIARISPGERLHLLPATRHRVVTWASVHDSGRRLIGPPAGESLPAFGPELVHAALRDHVRDWPAWVEAMITPGAQAYSVLTLCRAVQRLRFGRQLSKRRAADLTAPLFPEWADLIGWANTWWYDDGPDDDPGRGEEVADFVRRLSAMLLRSA